MKVKRFLAPIFLLCLLVGCGPEPTPTPDRVATQVALQQAAAATLTAQARRATPPPPATSATIPRPTDIPTATLQPPTPAPSSTQPPSATATPTLTAPPIVWRPEPYAVVSVTIDDVLNVRAGPGVAHSVVSTIPSYGMGVQVGDPGQEVDGAVWVPVQYQGIFGWVNSSYLARQVGSIEEGIAARAVQTIMAIKNQDMTTLATLVHPGKGVRFSPYTYVTDDDLVFEATKVSKLLSDPTVYRWGVFDGSGEPINLTFRQYYNRFIYDVHFVQPHVVGFDEPVGMGNTINNIADVYPGAVTVEYHFEGFDPQYAGMDWRSLRLVLEEKDGIWYLVGVVHDEWTT